MPKKQLIALCVCYFTFYVGLGTLVGIMPLYLPRLGADASMMGLFLASGYLSLAISTVVTGRLADYLQRRKVLLILGGVLAVPITWMISGVTSTPLLMLLMACLWFVTGMTLTAVTILTGIFSEEGERGKIFGILLLNEGIGLAFGALVNGRIVDRWGFPELFVLQAIFYLLIPIAGWFIQDKTLTRSKEETAYRIRDVLANRTFLFLFLASILGQAANILMFLAKPMLMDELHFDMTRITSTSGIGTLVTLPLPLIIGWLSDRVSKKLVIVACFIAVPVGLLLLTSAITEWHFWIVSVLQTGIGASVVAGSALMTDIFPEKALDASLSLYHATPWIGIVLGLSVGGVAIDHIQAIPTLIIGALLSLVATLLLVPLSASHRSIRLTKLTSDIT